MPALCAAPCFSEYHNVPDEDGRMLLKVKIKFKEYLEIVSSKRKRKFSFHE